MKDKDPTKQAATTDLQKHVDDLNSNHFLNLSHTSRYVTVEKIRKAIYGSTFILY
jgi:hypothetical protein